MFINYNYELPESGFDFSNCKRNEELKKIGIAPPMRKETSSTIAGVKFDNGVILGADTHDVNEGIILNKSCKKVHYLADNIYCCSSGISADADNLTSLVSAQLELMRLNTNRTIPVIAAKYMFSRLLYRNKGEIHAEFLIGGVDKNGAHIYKVYSHGSTDAIPYATMGTGSLAALSVFETSWCSDLCGKHAIKMVRDAIVVGISNDLGSGSNIDLLILNKDSRAEFIKYKVQTEKTQKQLKFDIRPGTTNVLKTKINEFEVSEEVKHIQL